MVASSIKKYLLRINRRMYSVTLNFNLLDILKLDKHLKNACANVEGLMYNSATQELVVNSEQTLTQQDIDAITQALGSYVNTPPPPPQQILNTGLQLEKVDTDTYKTVIVHNLKVDAGWELSSCLCEAFVIRDPLFPGNNQQLSYSIRVLDVSTNTVLGEGTFMNSEYEFCTIDIDDHNLGSQIHNLEVQVKRNIQHCIVCIRNANFVISQTF